MEPPLEKLAPTDVPTEEAELEITLSRDQLGISSKGPRVTLTIGALCAIVALQILLLWIQVKYDLPISLFFITDGIGTAAILAVTAMALFGRVKKPL
jgi:hypothetical protein